MGGGEYLFLNQEKTCYFVPLRHNNNNNYNNNKTNIYTG